MGNSAMRAVCGEGLALVALMTGAFPQATFADASQVVKSWRTPAAWLTELRQHADGARVCATGKAFGEGHPFGLSIVRSGQITLVTLVDEGRPPVRSGMMKLSASGKVLGDLAVTPEGPAFATTEKESEKARKLIAILPPTVLSIDVDGRRYQADLTGLDEARGQLEVCERQAAI
jgi:hypothetical protein